MTSNVDNADLEERPWKGPLPGNARQEQPCDDTETADLDSLFEDSDMEIDEQHEGNDDESMKESSSSRQF